MKAWVSVAWAVDSLWNTPFWITAAPPPPELAVGHPVLFLSPPSDDLSCRKFHRFSANMTLVASAQEVADTCSSLSESWDEHKSVLAHGSPDPNKQQGQYPQRYNVLLPKRCFSKRFFRRKTVKILFSNQASLWKMLTIPEELCRKERLKPCCDCCHPDPHPRVSNPSRTESPFPSLGGP